MIRVLGLTSAAVLLATSLAAQRNGKPDSPGPAPSEIHTSATASISVPANLAVVTLEFSARGRTARTAGKATATRANAIRRALIAIGIPRDSLPTGGPWGWWGDRARLDPGLYGKDTTYVVTEKFTARIRDLNLIGRAIDTALVEGASGVSNVQFAATDTQQDDLRALALATKRAREKASTIAEAEGGSLGRTLELSTDSPRDYYDFATQTVTTAAAGGGGTTIVSPEIQITASVRGRWELIPKH
jgi:uncharacterized protein